MQVANTLNNSIRILFNPRVESFKLFDFLMVKSDDCKYIAQIVEIYDDKFDASQNVAKLKLFYRINENNEVIPYDNFTPNKECEISKVKQEEIEDFINQDKETFILGTNAKTTCALNIQYDFFNNNAVVLADKIENANNITFNLAKKLSTKKNALIIDTTGVLELEGAKKIKACKNFKIPFNYTTIDSVFERCLKDASLEFQATGGQIINEIKKFARKQEDKFIPFNLLTRVLIQQHKATPYPELKLLLVRLKKYQMDEIFARTKAEKEALFKTIEKNPITIVDLSNLDSYWQKTYINYIISDIEQEIYLITRINDEHFDVDLINKIYNKKKNIKFVPNVSYNYKKLPTVMQNCKNYILMPSLTQRTDFLDANFALCNLISDGCIVFGENTDNFIYLAKDYELEIQEKRKNYRKIALSLAKQDDASQNLGEKGDYFENQKTQEEMSDSARLIKELSEFEASQKEALKEQEQEEYFEANQPSELLEEVRQTQESFDEIENPTPQEELVEDSKETVEPIEIKEEASDDFQDIEIKEETTSIQEEPEKANDKEETEEESSFEDILDSIDEEQKTDEIKEETTEEEIAIEENNEIEEVSVADDEITTTEIKKEKVEDTLEIETIDLSQKDEVEEDMDLSDDELDFFQMAEDENENEDEDELQEENQEQLQEELSDDLDLNEIADNSIDDNFEEIINSKNNQNTQKIALDEKTQIDADILVQPTQKENLPIFKDEEKKEKGATAYEIGNIIIHKKYGRGLVVKTIKYEERQLLQVEFEQAGKKLLDPTVADIKLEQ